MKMPDSVEVVKLAGCILSLLALSVALFAEAVDRAAAFDFNTPVGWEQFLSAIPLVAPEHLKLAVHDVMGLVGIITMLAWVLASKATIPTWILVGYSAAYFAVGGFLGIIAMVFVYFLGPIDGEFFQDGVANALGHSCWGFMLIVMIAHGFVKKRNLVVEMRGSLRREREKATGPTGFGL